MENMENRDSTVLVYLDDDAAQQQLVRGLQDMPGVKDRYVVQGLTVSQMKALVDILGSRRTRLYAGDAGSWQATSCALDSAAVLIVDEYPDQVGLLSGDTIAYAARVFSSCGVVVVARMQETFDLTLRPAFRFFADFRVGYTQLLSPLLWSTTPWAAAQAAGAYHPWSWPLLPELVKNTRQRELLAAVALDETVSQILGFTEIDNALPRSVAGLLGNWPEKVTLRQFVTSGEAGLWSHLGAMRDPLPETLLVRVAAARFAHWLERAVLPNQETLVDTAHLLRRYPGMLAGKGQDLATWNQAALWGRSWAEAHLLTEWLQPELEPFQSGGIWLSRPAWRWGSLRQSPLLENTWRLDHAEWVFAEDTARFYARAADGTVADLHEFDCEVESAFSHRYARECADIEYAPAVRWSRF